MKKYILLIITAIFLSSLLVAQDFLPTDDGSEIKFSIKNLGLHVNGSFKGLKGNMFFDKANLPMSSFNVSVEVATVNTGIEARDNHLKKEEYFDVAKYPEISFASTKISNSTKEGELFLEGDITIKGVTKSISFPFTATLKGNDYLFEGEFILNRRDFGVGGNSLVMADNLTVSLSVVGKKK